MSKEDRPSHTRPSGSRPPDGTANVSGMSRSMHDGVEVWCDCCSCEAEPYWLAAFEKQEVATGKD